MKSILLELEERMKAEILVRLKQLNAADGQDIPESLDDIDLSKHYLSEIESRSVPYLFILYGKVQ